MTEINTKEHAFAEQAGSQIGQETAKASFVEPKLTFVEPKLTERGDFVDLTEGFFGPFTPPSS